MTCLFTYCTLEKVQEVKKDMRDKVQTSLWLDRDVKRLIEDEGINLTRWVNTNILISLSVDSEDEILEKIAEHERCIKTLNERLVSLKSRKTSENAEVSLSKQALFELRERFDARVDNEMSREQNLSWIMAPKNLGRCKILKKTSEQMLDELEAWYDGKKKGEHEENK